MRTLWVLSLTAVACAQSSGGLPDFGEVPDAPLPGTGAGSPTSGSESRSGGSSSGGGAMSGDAASGGSAGTSAGAAGSSGASGAAGSGVGAPLANGPSISCAGAPCQSPAQHCCITGEGSGNPPAFQCIPANIGCGLMALERMCDAGEDCGGGEICCASTTFASTPSKCRTECLAGEQRTCWTGSECGGAGPFCCFFPGRPAGFCGATAHPGATICVQ